MNSVNHGSSAGTAWLLEAVCTERSFVSTLYTFIGPGKAPTRELDVSCGYLLGQPGSHILCQAKSKSLLNVSLGTEDGSIQPNLN